MYPYSPLGGPMLPFRGPGAGGHGRREPRYTARLAQDERCAQSPAKHTLDDLRCTGLKSAVCRHVSRGS